MTIEEKVRSIILEALKEQTDFCKRIALGDIATLTEQEAILDKTTQAILALIKPISKEGVALLKELSQKYKEMIAIMQEHKIVINNLDDVMQKYAFTLYAEIVQLGSKADAILAEWKKGLKWPMELINRKEA